MKKDYYEILGVARDASVQDIKKAYRSLALKYHPDRVPAEEKKAAEERFKEISEAYGVISDPQKRKLYDQYGHSGIDQNFTAEDIFKGADFSGFNDLGDIFSQFFGDGFDLFGGGRGGSGYRAQQRAERVQRGRDIQYELEVSLEEAFQGVSKKIKVPRHEHCTACNGSGAKSNAHKKTCASCGGSGQVIMSSGFFRMAQTCSACGGRGETITEYCATCQGKGVNRVVRSIDVTVPPGVDNDTRLRVRGEGEVGSGGPGDLYLYLLVKEHPVFRRAGQDIELDLPVHFLLAALGGEVTVATLSGDVAMKIPAGTQSGKVFRLRGKGMPSLRGGDAGDQYVRVMVSVPTRLSPEERRLLEELAEVSDVKGVLKGRDSALDKVKKIFK